MSAPEPPEPRFARIAAMIRSLLAAMPYIGSAVPLRLVLIFPSSPSTPSCRRATASSSGTGVYGYAGSLSALGVALVLLPVVIVAVLIGRWRLLPTLFHVEQ